MRLRETPIQMKECDTPARAVQYWKECVVPTPWVNLEVETMVVLNLNARRRIIHHNIVSNGILDTLLAHAREIFKTAIVGNASAIIVMHNHPSGDPSPSEADIKVTRDLVRAGQLLKIELLDHVIVGVPGQGGVDKGWASLKELGYIY